VSGSLNVHLSISHLYLLPQNDDPRNTLALSEFYNDIWFSEIYVMDDAFSHYDTIPRDRSFAVHGPVVWNSLPADLRLLNISLPVFRKRLKMFMFYMITVIVQRLTWRIYCVAKFEVIIITRKLCYDKDNRAMRAI